MLIRQLLCIVFLAAPLWAQQPFLTDDADVADRGHFHLEILSEHDWLQGFAYPAVHQNTTRYQVTYGAADRLEVGVDYPLLFIANDRIPNATGFGDLDLQMKYRVYKKKPDSRWPAFTVGLYIELPTGNKNNSLGSGIADYWLNTILQKSLSTRLTLRSNLGILFAGNTLTGVIGISSVHGLVFTGASSLTYQLTQKLLVGTEIAGAATDQLGLGKSQVQILCGAKYALTKRLGLDFAATGGKFEGSPRLGGAFGVSIDF